MSIRDFLAVVIILPTLALLIITLTTHNRAEQMQHELRMKRLEVYGQCVVNHSPDACVFLNKPQTEIEFH